MKKNNPIISELQKINFLNKKNLKLYHKGTRDCKAINVLKDKKTGVILLDQFKRDEKYYKNFSIKNKLKKTSNKSNNNSLTLIDNKLIKSCGLDDDKRRYNQFKKYIINKKILDFGCAWGNFLKICTKARLRHGVEIRKECINFLKKNNNILIENDINKFDGNFDVITLFHVLEHLPHQIKTLNIIKKKMNKGGKLIIEVPSASDFLLSFPELASFKKFTFWSEHLVLHTHSSLKKILYCCGFKKIKIISFQRYNLNNHLGWLIENKPGGHDFFKNKISKKLIKNYSSFLIHNKKTDTIIAICEK